MQDDEEKDLSGLVRQALAPAVLLEKYPKALIDVYITVLESDGCGLFARVQKSVERVGGCAIMPSCCDVFAHFHPQSTTLVTALAAAVTCASLALANGGIEMRDLVCGSSQALCQDTLLMDPTSAEEAAAVSLVEGGGGLYVPC